MQYEFLKNFSMRMKNTGLYAVLIQNITNKKSWAQYGFEKSDEQINFVFAILLYIMEQSLKEDDCTIDDISTYIDDINTQYFEKSLSYDDCKQLADFVINNVLSNEGKMMYFDGYEFENKKYRSRHISYISNKIIYTGQEVKRTSYYLTDDGYNLLLSTFEIENNMKITIYEMIFKLHLEKQSYDKATDDIKRIFERLRIQFRKIQEDMLKIKRNVLEYSVKEYEEIMLENLESVSETKNKFAAYRQMVLNRVNELEEEHINIRVLNDDEKEKLRYLKIIGEYLTRTIDEHQRILNSHFDLKELYAKELENISQMVLIKRFRLRPELYQKVLEEPSMLENIDIFFRPLFSQDISKIYNMNKAFNYEKHYRKKTGNGEEEGVIDFDDEEWQIEKEQKRQEKLRKYSGSLEYILHNALKAGTVSVKELAEILKKDAEGLRQLIPDKDIFKEIMVELIKSRTVDIDELRKEKQEYLQDTGSEFRLSEMLLNLADNMFKEYGIKTIVTERADEKEIVTIELPESENGIKKVIRCSNVTISVKCAAQV